MEFDPQQKAYYDPKTGKFLSERRVRSIASQERLFTREQFSQLAAEYSADGIDANTWFAEFIQATKEHTIRQYLLARGGRSQMTARDWGVVGRTLRDQYGYASAFLDDLPDLSESQIRARSHLYAAASTYSFHRGLFNRFGIPVTGLPMPGQNTRCRANCRCWWEVIRLSGEGNYDLKYHREAGDSCDTCITRAIVYATVKVREGVVQRAAELLHEFEFSMRRSVAETEKAI